jgi:phosphoglycolate phosphatase
MPKKINADTLVFDFNGTLIDDRNLCLSLLNGMLQSSHHEPVTFERYLDIFTFPIIDYYRKAGFVFKPQGPDDFDVLAKRFDHDYTARFSEASLFPDVITTLTRYQGKKRLIVLSATKQDNLESQLNALGLLSYFDTIIGIKDIYGASKLQEARDFFAKNAFDPSRTVFIGDTLHDDEVAVALHAHSILVTRGHQSVTRIEEGKSDLSAPSLRACWDLIE